MRGIFNVEHVLGCPMCPLQVMGRNMFKLPTTFLLTKQSMPDVRYGTLPSSKTLNFTTQVTCGHACNVPLHPMPTSEIVFWGRPLHHATANCPLFYDKDAN
jgi:hypothetical protein